MQITLKQILIRLILNRIKSNSNSNRNSNSNNNNNNILLKMLLQQLNLSIKMEYLQLISIKMFNIYRFKMFLKY